jgi:dienelactone hydrolase
MATAVSRTMRLPLVAVVIAFATSLFAADTPVPLPIPKRIPPPGITLTDAERHELTKGAAALRAEIDALTNDLAGDPKLRARLPDVEIFHKAVDWALRYDEFMAPKEIAFARHLLEAGRQRAAQLRTKQAPWLDATGLVVRGHRSKLDGSVQPYGLVVPPEVDRTKPVTVMVWLLGRGEKRTELAFLAEREAGPPPVMPKGVVTVIPYGRFCNATKFAGEVDVFEALAAARELYRGSVTLVGGFSMGGGSTWHLATHYPFQWAVAAPGAGFAETPIFTKAHAPNKEQRPAWEQTLWRLYEATGLARNLFNLPTIAYSGELDGQKEAADLMEAAMAKEGLKLEHFIGPQTQHRYHPETKEVLTRRLEELAAQSAIGSFEKEIRYSTYTLRYPQAGWMRIEGLEKHWERADLRAWIADDLTIHAETRNITALWCNWLQVWAGYPGKVEIDGQVLQKKPDELTMDSLVRRDGKWGFARLASDRPGKRPGFTGPVDDAFMEPFVFVRPTGKPLNPELGTWVEAELTAARQLWRDVFRGHPRVKSDREIAPDDIADCNLILWGDPSSNAVLAKIIAQLPLQWDAKTLTFRGKSYPAAHHAPILVFPNPLNPRRYVVLNSGIDFRADGYGNNALQTPKLPDWAIIDLRTPPGPRWPGKVVDAGFFDEDWK